MWDRMRNLPRFLTVLVLLACSGCGENKSLGSDMWAFFECRGGGQPQPALVEKFLGSHGFSSVDAERVRRQYGRGFYPLEMEAYDARRRMVTVQGIAFESKGGVTRVDYSVSLDSPPPTHHDTKLETAILEFVGGSMKCRITSHGRSENAGDTAGFYDQLFKLQQSRIHEARICDKEAKTYDAAACRNVPGIKPGT
jgi:hypothetical protein